METKWYRLPDRDNYEVSDEDEPKVRNRSTGVIRKTTPRKTVGLYFDPKHKSVMFSVYHLQYAAIHGIKARNIPKDIIITKENGDFRLTDRREFCKSLNDRYDRGYERDTQLKILEETETFIKMQAEAVRTRQFARLAELLYRYRKNARELAGRFSNATPNLYKDIDDYASTAVVSVIDRIMRGVIIATHPTAALKTEIVKMIKHKKKTVQPYDWRIYRHSKVYEK